MTLLGSLIALLIIFIGIAYSNYRLQLLLVIFSLLSSDFYFDVYGSKLPYHFLIGLWWFISFKMSNIKILNLLVIEYGFLILTGFYFVWLAPWQDNYEAFKPWNQQLVGRFITSMFKLTFEIIFLYGSYKFLNHYKITSSEIIRLVLNLSVILVLIALFDFTFGYPLRNLFFENIINDNQRLYGRLVGFCHEPKAFARSLLFPLALILGTQYKFVAYQRIKFLLIFFAFALTLSVSGYLTFFIGFIVLMFFIARTHKINFEQGFILILFGILMFSLTTLLNYDYLIGVKYKLDYVLSAAENTKIYSQEPLIFTRLEVFDRATVNFFYEHPLNLFFGCGPNLISIPASSYMTLSSRQVLGDYLVGGPTIGLLTILARSGIVGVMLYLRFFYKSLSRFSLSKDYRYAGVMLGIMFFMNTLPFVLFFIISINSRITKND